MASNIIGNRNSTPEASKSSLRPPQARVLGSATNQTMRLSADGSSFPSPVSARGIRPASEVLYNQQSQSIQDDSSRLGEQWIQDIEQYEQMLEEMAAATLDQDFKTELSAIEQWFRVLSEAERTAATYALIQQTTQMQQRFFAQVLNQMSKSHPVPGVLSPTSFGEKDPMSSRLSDAMSKLNVEPSRNSIGRPPASPAANKRNSGLDPSRISAMFPDAVAAIAQQRAEYQQQTGDTVPSSSRLSVVGSNVPGARDSKTDSINWRQSDSQQLPISRPKSSSGQQPPMGQFTQPPASASIRSPHYLDVQNDNIKSTMLTAPGTMTNTLPILSPYNAGNWASMTNTPMAPNFHAQLPISQNAMLASATKTKLLALSTGDGPIALDDVKKYRRARSNESQQPPLSPGLPSGIPGINTIMVNEDGQVLNQQQQVAAMQALSAASQRHRSRPNSPGVSMQQYMPPTNFALPQGNGFLSANMMSPGLAGLGQSFSSEYITDSEINRGRSPRRGRGSSKPPEDPTDLSLLNDIPAWLRQLRLHKYTDQLKDLTWEVLVQLDDKGLEARGVNALGARNKLLKVFEQVREAQAAGKI